jgi:NitT/TauT family transport system substrate-binding protein
MSGLLWALIIFCSGLPLYAQGRREQPQGLELKAAVFKGPSGFGMVKLLEEAPVLGDDVSISFQVLPTPQEMVARVSSGEIDIAVFPTNLAAKLYNGGVRYPMAAVVGYGLLHLLSSDREIVSWADMEGMEIHSVGKGASPEYLLRYYLASAGLDPERDVDLNFSIQAAPQLAQALIGGKVSYAVLPEPFATLVTVREPSITRVIDFQQSWLNLFGGEGERSYPITVVVVSPSLIEKNRSVLDRFLESCKESIEWVKSNPSEAAVLIEKHDIMPAAIAEPAIGHCNLDFVTAGESRTEVEAFLRVLLDFAPESVGGRLPVRGFYLE